jgi:DNA-binding NarL/FixJ family response regulator
LRKWNIHICDDHSVISLGITSVLSASSKFNLITVSSTYEELLSSLKKNDYDVLILDIFLRETNMIDRIPGLVSTFPNIKIVVVSSSETQFIIRSALKTGAHAYVTKIDAASSLLVSIDAVLNNQIYVSEIPAEQEGAAALISGLTDRELEIFKLLVEGLPNNTIGEKLFLSIDTIKTHRKKIYQKLNVNSIAELIVLARRHNLF